MQIVKIHDLKVMGRGTDGIQISGPGAEIGTRNDAGLGLQRGRHTAEKHHSGRDFEGYISDRKLKKRRIE